MSPAIRHISSLCGDMVIGGRNNEEYVLFWCQKRTRKSPAISTRWIHEKGAARPFQTPKELSKPKNASRFAKRIFLCFSYLRLRRRFHLSAGHYRQQRGNTSCEAASRRNEKKAFGAAASFFPFRPLLRGLKGASSPFLATATTAACGGYREELLGQRPAGCER